MGFSFVTVAVLLFVVVVDLCVGLGSGIIFEGCMLSSSVIPYMVTDLA